ncbi:hypothetical protein B0T16DRAFT_444241 [Cercophora newfieldiana]|uniref:Uncharacterized protein n=1 Tax=Cercophora newfieldiana TaxID=92897 RepID=A0AA40CSR7_9PEZI|nr:hypothetical protein B0T16DRAFT_444241 [Cercophora newfieldiana]
MTIQSFFSDRKANIYLHRHTARFSRPHAKMSTMLFRTQQPVRLFTSERALAHHDVLRSEQVDTHLRRGPNFNCLSPGPLAFPFPQPPSTPRPSPNHFAVVVLHAQTVEAAMYWAELRDGELVVNITELLEFNQKMLSMAASRLKEGRCILDFTEADFNNTIFYLRHLETNVLEKIGVSPDFLIRNLLIPLKGLPAYLYAIVWKTSSPLISTPNRERILA